ncbi:MAG: hypothetical protein QM731_23440 [Chitinophagaceae bacterium]
MKLLVKNGILVSKQAFLGLVIDKLRALTGGLLKLSCTGRLPKIFGTTLVLYKLLPVYIDEQNFLISNSPLYFCTVAFFLYALL